jgi:hypothetical protein
MKYSISNNAVMSKYDSKKDEFEVSGTVTLCMEECNGREFEMLMRALKDIQNQIGGLASEGKHD